MAAPEEEILKLIGDYRAYHPSQIYLQKRLQKQKKVTEEAEATHQEENRPEGIEGRIWDAENFMKELEAAANDQLKPLLEELQSLFREALDVAKDDEHRRRLNKRFQAAREKWDQFCLNFVLWDKKIFAGETKEDPIVFPMGDQASSALKFSIESFDSKHTGLDKIEISNLMEARRGIAFMERFPERIEMIHEIISSKRSFLKVQKKTLADEKREKELQQKQKLVTNEDLIQKKQLRAAKAKGRVSALLLNVKG